MAGLGYEVLTGLMVFFAPFSVFNQYGVLLHTLDRACLDSRLRLVPRTALVAPLPR